MCAVWKKTIWVEHWHKESSCRRRGVTAAQRSAEMSGQPICDFPVWSCGPRSPPSRGFSTSSHAARTSSCFLSVCHHSACLSLVSTCVTSFTCLCVWCAGRAGRAGEEGTRSHRRPGQKQPGQEGCRRAELGGSGRGHDHGAQKRRVTHQRKAPVFRQVDTTDLVFNIPLRCTLFYILFLFYNFHLLLLHSFAPAQFTDFKRSCFLYLEGRSCRGVEGLSFSRVLQYDGHLATLQPSRGSVAVYGVLAGFAERRRVTFSKRTCSPTTSW